MAEDRFLPLDGASNFRDFGGYRAGAGHRIRRACLYRSNKLSALSEADGRRLDALGLRAVFDLRIDSERAADPTRWAAPELMVRTFPPGAKRRLVDMALQYPTTLEGVLALMHDFYAEMPFTMAPVLAAVLRELAAGAAPCLIHCSAGKDRTGLAVALVQAALGVGRADLLEDYALTNARTRPASDMVRAVAPDLAEGEFRRRYPAEAIAAMMAADPAYLQAALDAAEAKHGTLLAFIRDGLQVDDATVERLRAMLLEPG